MLELVIPNQRLQQVGRLHPLVERSALRLRLLPAVLLIGLVPAELLPHSYHWQIFFLSVHHYPLALE